MHSSELKSMVSSKVCVKGAVIEPPIHCPGKQLFFPCSREVSDQNKNIDFSFTQETPTPLRRIQPTLRRHNYVYTIGFKQPKKEEKKTKYILIFTLPSKDV